MMTSGSQPVEDVRYPELEGVRAILALWVVLSHALLLTAWSSDLIWPLGVLRRGGLAVVGFMIVSGFAISHLVIKNREPYKLYIWRRFLRLFPLLFAATAAGILLHLYNPEFASYDDKYLWAYLASRAVMLHGIIPQEILFRGSTAIVGPAWSISLEWQFYLIAPFLILSFYRSSYWLGILAALLPLCLVSSALYIYDYTFTFTTAFLPVSIVYFLIGIASYQLVQMFPKKEIPLSMGCFAVVLTYAITKNHAFALWVFVVFAILGVRSFSNFLSLPFMRYLGEISYSIYLVHALVFLPLRWGVLAPYIEYKTVSSLLLLTIPSLALTLIISHFTYNYVEKPFIRFGKTGTFFKRSTPVQRIIEGSDRSGAEASL